MNGRIGGWVDGWVGGFEFARGMSGWADGRMGGWVDGWFMKLMKLKKKRKITLSFTSPETDYFFYIYEVFTWENK